jgi:hypothetical protein
MMQLVCVTLASESEERISTPSKVLIMWNNNPHSFIRCSLNIPNGNLAQYIEQIKCLAIEDSPSKAQRESNHHHNQ